MRRLALLAVLLSACASPAGRLDPGAALPAGSRDAVVFGRLLIVEDGRDATPYPALWESKPTVYLWSLERWGPANPPSVRFSGSNVERDGRFFWRLPPGTYVVGDVRHDYFVKPKAAFRAPEAGKSYYVGTLVLETETARQLGRRALKRLVRSEVVDDFQAAAALYGTRNPAAPRPEKALMVRSDAIPDEFSQVRAEALRSALLNAGLGVLMIAP